MSDTPPNSVRSVLKWWPIILAVLTVLGSFGVSIAAIEPQLDATNDNVTRLRGDLIEHRAKDAHPRSGAEQARTGARLDTLERIPEQLDRIDARLQAIENKQNAMCASFPSCRRHMTH